ncbi:MAG TPA: copper homeostasis protein CutC [Candidatus Eisenbacteria bacterium]|nr:copper homeostasis protein CutC [Candidatus Eisenbacteria bacterium]
MLTPPLLEIAVANLERARATERAGAGRIELCEQLELGGLTPGLDLVRQARAAVILPFHVLVRPRPGNFVYSAVEFSAMKSQIAALRREHIQGIVTGILRPDCSVDIERTRELVEAAAPLEVTFHRAFDETPDLLQSLEAVILTGARRLLTSGGKPSAADSSGLLRQLIAHAAGRIQILPGGGLHAGNIAVVAQLLGVRELHTGLGAVLPYNDPDSAKFESALRACLAALRNSA